MATREVMPLLVFGLVPSSHVQQLSPFAVSVPFGPPEAAGKAPGLETQECFWMGLKDLVADSTGWQFVMPVRGDAEPLLPSLEVRNCPDPNGASLPSVLDDASMLGLQRQNLRAF